MRLCRNDLHCIDLPGARLPDGRCAACRRARQRRLDGRYLASTRGILRRAVQRAAARVAAAIEGTR